MHLKPAARCRKVMVAGFAMTMAQLEHRMFGHYRVLAQIGSGGMGEVYRAHDEHLDRDVALKILSAVLVPGKEIDSRARRGLRQEALTLSRLNHPNIAQVYDFDQDGGIDFIAMELVPGSRWRKDCRRGQFSRSKYAPSPSRRWRGWARPTPRASCIAI